MANRSLPLASFAAVLVLAFAFNASSAAAYSCEPQVNQTLQQRGVDQAEVESVKLTRRTGGARSSSIYSLDAWVRLKSCSSGALVVNLTRYCMVKQVYTTGDCHVGQLPNY